MSETTNVVEMENDKRYALRGLGAKDVFLMAQIIGKIGISKFVSDEGITKISTMSSGKSADEMLAQIGVGVLLNIIDVILGNLQKCEKDIYKFLSHLSGMTEKEVENLDMITFTEMVVDIIKKEEFKGFMTVVSKLFK